ncbi:hypothetical protein BVRB_7g161170 [Beta vulgaris subsp. vulgaris]|nr:hypothetical protein BVRB_7g161170 [Beta vulgaris subsp. vulgaris]
MKRELAALVSKSPVLDSSLRATRSSKRSSGVGVTESLVYKRVKKSVQVAKAELLSNGVHGVVEVSRTSDEEVVGCRNAIRDDSKEVEERENVVAVENVDEPSSMVVEVKDGLDLNNVEEQGLVVAGENAVVTEVDDIIGGSIEDDKDKLVEEVLTKSPLNAVNGDAKKSSVDSYPRRFTRSALKAKVDTVATGDDSVDGTVENSKVVMNEDNGEVCKEIVVVETSMSVSKGEVDNLSPEKHTRRFTRSVSKPKSDDSELCSVGTVILDTEKAVRGTSNENGECDVDKAREEPSSATPRRKLEMKMSKQISHAKIPSNVQELLATGLLEGCPVYYDGGKGLKLNGRIRGIGILCSCGLCKGCKVIPPSLFEIHACNKYKRAAQYIYLENGRSLIQILKACKSTRLDTLEATVQNAIGPLPEKKFIICENCKEPYSSMDAETPEPVCSKCVMSNLSPIGPVYSTRKRCRSSKFVFPSQAASECGDLQDNSERNTSEKSAEAFLTPKSHTSQSDMLLDALQKRSQSLRVKRSADTFLTPKLRSSPRIRTISGTMTHEEMVNNSQEASFVPKICDSPVMEKSAGSSCSKKLKKRSFKAASSPKSFRSARGGKSSLGNDSAKALKRSRKELLTPKVPKTPSALKSSEKTTSGKITRKDLRLHKLVFEDDVLPDGTELGYYARGQKLLDGFKKGSGIFCNCCDMVVSASQFEAHAGCASRRKPYCYIYTSNGVSLHELSVTLIKDRLQSAKYNDDLCSICADGGNLLLCDGCPRAFHKVCASLPSIPQGKWYCKYCENMFEREKFVSHNANALAAGRVSGVDPIEQITKRSIRIVNNLASEVSACILCREYDFCKSGFGPRTIILCDQCEKEYHVGCLKDHSMADLTELPDGKWFCSSDCGKIDASLQNLLVRGVENLPESLVDTIRKKNMQIGSDSETGLDVSWRLLSGKIASPETRPLLSQAVAIFHESFSPIIDVVSGHDLIPAMVYGRNVGGQEYGGMYCAVLTVNSVVVSAGIFRIFGPEIAELPLVATSSGNHGKGYFQTLFVCIERLLAFLKIKTIVLPAAEEAGSIWTDRFGFEKMTLEELRELKRNFWSIVRFQGTSMLHKSVPECRDFECLAQ